MMRTKSVSFTYKEFDSAAELTSEERELVGEAGKAAINAYAPYSRFRVGAALRLESGKIICGANVENAAFPSGICAERNAISNAVSNHPHDKPTCIAITAINYDGVIEESLSPCGNCRQVIAEEESRTGNKIRIILASRSNIIVFDSISDLLPLQFNSKNLKISLP